LPTSINNSEKMKKPVDEPAEPIDGPAKPNQRCCCPTLGALPLTRPSSHRPRCLLRRRRASCVPLPAAEEGEVGHRRKRGGARAPPSCCSPWIHTTLARSSLYARTAGSTLLADDHGLKRRREVAPSPDLQEEGRALP
jgi:hypothetical protein